MTEASPESHERQGIPVAVWLLIGCGGLGILLFFLMIIAAIALPSFLNQANKARQAEAKQSMAAMVRAEQAYFLENSKFTASLSQLEVGLPTESPNYRYSLKLQSGKPQPLMITATPKKTGLKSYSAAVFAVKDGQELLPVGQVCETERPSSLPPAMPVAPATPTDAIECPAGSLPIFTKLP